MRFTDILEKVKYRDQTYKNFSEKIFNYAVSHYTDSRRFKESVVRTMNTLMYNTSKGILPNLLVWSWHFPFENIEWISDSECKKAIPDMYIDFKDIEWDLEPVDPIVISKIDEGHRDLVDTVRKSMFPDVLDSSEIKESKKDDKKLNELSAKSSEVETEDNEEGKVSKPVKSQNKKSKKLSTYNDISVKPPSVPRFDVDRPWLEGYADGNHLAIYTSLPEVPKVQNQISVTTDINNMTDADLLNLYPNTTLNTRYKGMYYPIEGLEYSEIFGSILEIEGFTHEQVRDNIIKYPHIYKLQRIIDDKPENFYHLIEIDGKLESILDVWEDLPESEELPRHPDYIKEYVVRRYLLERDIKGIKHNYPLWGTLEPFLTLFTTPENYIKMGYTDIIGMARQCVLSRVSFKQSRNPIIRRLKAENN